MGLVMMMNMMPLISHYSRIAPMLVCTRASRKLEEKRIHLV